VSARASVFFPVLGLFAVAVTLGAGHVCARLAFANGVNVLTLRRRLTSRRRAVRRDGSGSPGLCQGVRGPIIAAICTQRLGR
jgi:hypothetical protein